MRGEFEDDALGHIRLKDTTAACKALQGLYLLCGVTQNSDEDDGITQVGRDVHGIHRDQGATGRHLAQDSHTQFALEDFGDADHAVFNLNV